MARPETYYLVFPNLIDYDIGVTLFTCCLRPDSVDCDQSRKRIFTECFRMNEEYILERKGDFAQMDKIKLCADTVPWIISTKKIESPKFAVHV